MYLDFVMRQSLRGGYMVVRQTVGSFDQRRPLKSESHHAYCKLKSEQFTKTDSLGPHVLSHFGEVMGTIMPEVGKFIIN